MSVNLAAAGAVTVAANLAASKLFKPQQNKLLASLPPADLAHFSHQLELVSMPLGMMLYEPNARQQYAYFPVTSITALHYVCESGATAETASIGNEGMIGVALFLGGNTTPSSAMVHTAGFAYRLDHKVLKTEFERAGALQVVLLRYVQALHTHVAQTALCYRHHPLEQQLSRWLLQTHDRLTSNELVITQEMVSNLLGVRRESITEAAGNLQRAGLISYRRGHISVLNKAGLEKHTCECYAVIKNERHRIAILPL